MRRIRALCVFVIVLGVAALPPLTGAGRAADELVADLSEHLIAITTGFTGTDVLLFGAIEGEGDVVVVVRGPARPTVVRRKGRFGPIWVNEADMTFDGVPSYYAVAASRPLDAFLPAPIAARHEIGVDNLRFTPPEGADAADADAFRRALIRNKQRADLFSVEPARISFLGNRLFRTDMRFPANAPVGAYTVQVLLLRDGDVVGAEITPLVVSKLGFEAGVFDFAHRHSLAYGVLAILIAAVAGWIAGAAFRKD